MRTMSNALNMLGLICKTCGRDRQWHEDNATRHPYNDGSIPPSETFGKRLADGTRVPATPADVQAVEARWPFDPVLRQALINKGVITPEDLTNAEAQIRAVTDQFNASGGVST